MKNQQFNVGDIVINLRTKKEFQIQSDKHLEWFLENSYHLHPDNYLNKS